MANHDKSQPLPVSLPPPRVNTTLFVGELNWWTTEVELESELAKYGPVKELRIFTHTDSGQSKSCARVDYHNLVDAVECEQGMNGHAFSGRPCIVRLCSSWDIQSLVDRQVERNRIRRPLSVENRRSRCLPGIKSMQTSDHDKNIGQRGRMGGGFVGRVGGPSILGTGPTGGYQVGPSGSGGTFSGGMASMYPWRPVVEPPPAEHVNPEIFGKGIGKWWDPNTGGWFDEEEEVEPERRRSSSHYYRDDWDWEADRHLCDEYRERNRHDRSRQRREYDDNDGRYRGRSRGKDLDRSMMSRWRRDDDDDDEYYYKERNRDRYLGYARRWEDDRNRGRPRGRSHSREGDHKNVERHGRASSPEYHREKSNLDRDRHRGERRDRDADHRYRQRDDDQDRERLRGRSQSRDDNMKRRRRGSPEC